MLCEEGKGSPGVPQEKYFQQKSGKSCCAAQFSSATEKKDEFILQRLQRGGTVVTKEGRVPHLQSRAALGACLVLQEEE